MKLLVVGHTYVTAFAQCKYVSMKQLDSTLQLRIVTPAEVRHVFMRYTHTRHTSLSPEETVTIPIVLGQPPSTYVFRPVEFWRVLREFQPEHIHIEEDPHSLAGFETVALAWMACPKASISFFIWDNLARAPHFPVNFLKRILTQYSLSRADLVVCGNTEAEHLLRTVKHYERRSAVIPQLGLDPQDFALPPNETIRAQFKSAHSAPLIGYVGRLVPEKGLEILLESSSQLQALPWRLFLIGGGPLREEIQTRWQSRLAERLVVLDAVSHNEVADYLKCLDIFVLPSYGTPVWKEQFGLTLAQAMLAGLACIGSSCGAIPEVLGDGGVIVPERDVNALANALKDLIQSPEKRHALGQKAKKIASQRYTNQAVAQSYLTEFEKLRPLTA